MESNEKEFQLVEPYLLLPLLQFGRILFVEPVGQRLETFQRIVAVGRVNFIQIDARAFHFSVRSKRQFAQTLEFHDVHLRTQVFGQVAVNAEGNHAIRALERARILRRRRSERQVHVDFVEVGDGTLVLLQMALCAEAYGTSLAPEWPLEVVDVDVQPQLRRLGEHFVADAARRFAVVRQFVGGCTTQGGR